jgi:hypothetical protein
MVKPLFMLSVIPSSAEVADFNNGFSIKGNPELIGAFVRFFVDVCYLEKYGIGLGDFF